jgi:hypothetical protein
MPDPHHIATNRAAILTATAALSAAFEATKKEAGILSASLAQSPDYREGVMRGIALCIEAIEQFEKNVDEAATNAAALSLWLLTLPVILSDEQDVRDQWANPYSWPGDWTQHDNEYEMVVRASDEDDARRYAAEYDCDIWLDPAYARCLPLDTGTPGVIVASGGEAENE